MNNLDSKTLEWIPPLTREIADEVRTIGSKLIGLSHAIHSNPELRFEEYQASNLVSQYLQNEGFKLTTGLADLQTAFRAERYFGADGPTMGIFCEYDALPGIGHACGHNIIASAGAGAAVAACRWLARNNISSGRIVVIGSPGEEGGGGKIHLINAGCLKDIDAMVMVHPSGYNAIERPNLGRMAFDITFMGKASHAAAAPDRGRNALDGVTLMLNSIGLLRQQLRQDSRVHTIVSDGGQAVNIIPERAQIKLFIRSPDEDYLTGRLFQAIHDCAKGCALATATQVEIIESSPTYRSMKPNPVLMEITQHVFESLGRNIDPESTNPNSSGSTDMGNVSRVLPAIHPYICVIPGLAIHTREFEAAAVSKEGDKAVTDGATTLGTVVASMISHPELVNDAKIAFDLMKST